MPQHLCPPETNRQYLPPSPMPANNTLESDPPEMASLLETLPGLL